MPMAAPRPCRICHQPGCTTHKRQAWTRRTPTVRIRGRRLQVLRQDLWARNKGVCTQCGQAIHLDHMVRDHIVPLAEGGEDIEANTQPLCQSCSDAKTQQEAIRGRSSSHF